MKKPTLVVRPEGRRSRSEPGVMMPLAVLVLLGIVAWARRPAFLRRSDVVAVEGARA